MGVCRGGEGSVRGGCCFAGLLLLALCAAAAAVAHAMLYIFAIYFTQHKFICGCNFNSRATVASTPLLPPPTALVIVAAASLVNALHFVATGGREERGEMKGGE